MLEQFYADVLPRSGQYALFLGNTKQHLWAGSIPELVAKTEALIEDGVHGVYFATAGFKTRDNRTQENVQSLRALRLDIDAGEEKYAKHPDDVYRTQEAALQAFVAFSRATALAPTYVVSSGAGLHVYYCLDTDLEPLQWLPLARGLQRAAVERGLLVDSTVTTDSARVLRPLGTLHHSGAEVRALLHAPKTYSPEDLRAVLGVSRFADMAERINQDVADTRDFQGPPVSVNKILPKCAALQHAAHNHDIAEPYWRAMIGLVKHTVEGDEACHVFSNGYPGYSFEETERKIANWKAGPTTCEEFANHFAGCRECPHWGKLKSPIKLGWMNTEEIKELPPEQQPQITVPAPKPGMPWVDKIESPFYVDALGNLCTKTSMQLEGEGGEKTEAIVPVPITSTPFWFESWGEFDDDGDTSIVQMALWNGRTTRRFTMDLSIIASPSDYLKHLAGKGIVLQPDKRAKQAMDDYLKTQLNRIRLLHMRPKYRDRLGMRIEEGGELVAVHGRYVINGDGVITEAMLGGALAKPGGMFEIAPLAGSRERQWGAEVWPTLRSLAAEHVRFIQHYYADPSLKAFQLTIMAMLASPLMPFVTGQYRRPGPLPANGLTISLYSRSSGKGKTMACKTAMLAFGNPEAMTKSRDDLSATDNNTRRLLSHHGTMPVVMDEMGEMDAKKLARLISAVANAAFKERMDSRYGSDTPWALVNVLTTNVPARDMIQQARAESSAIQYRMLELDVEDVPKRPEEVAAQFEFELGDLTARAEGALGAFMELLYCRLGVDKLNELVRESVERARSLTGNSQEGRFQWRAMGAVLALQRVLETVGLPIFNQQDLEDTFVAAFHAGNDYIREATMPQSPAEMMALMLSDLRPFTLVTDTETHRGHNPGVRDIPLNVGGIPREVKARAVVKGGYTYVSAEAFKDWCHKRGLSHVTLAKDAAKQGVFLRMGKDVFRGKLDLFKGTAEEGAGGVIHVYKVNTRSLQSVEEYPDNVVPLPTAHLEPTEGRKVE